MHLSVEAMSDLANRAIQSLWHSPSDGADSSEDAFESAVTLTLNEWDQRERLQQEELSQISAALEARASAERLLLTDAAMGGLRQRVLSALRRGEGLDAAVSAVLRDWQRQLVRKQVQQTVWDPSGNSTRKVTG